MGEVVVPAVRLAPGGDDGGPLGARGGGVAGQRGPGVEPDQRRGLGHRTPQLRRASSANARAAVDTSATGTRSLRAVGEVQVAGAVVQRRDARRRRTAAGRCRPAGRAPAAARRRRRRPPARTVGQQRATRRAAAPLANAPPVQVSRTGWSASQGSAGADGVPAGPRRPPWRVVDRLAEPHAVAALGDQPVGHRAGPVAGLRRGRSTARRGSGRRRTAGRRRAGAPPRTRAGRRARAANSSTALTPWSRMRAVRGAAGAPPAGR